MTPEEKKLYALMAIAEEQQNAINQAIQNLNLTQEQIQNVIAKQTQVVLDRLELKAVNHRQTYKSICESKGREQGLATLKGLVS